MLLCFTVLEVLKHARCHVRAWLAIIQSPGVTAARENTALTGSVTLATHFVCKNHQFIKGRKVSFVGGGAERCTRVCLLKMATL